MTQPQQNQSDHDQAATEAELNEEATLAGALYGSEPMPVSFLDLAVQGLAVGHTKGDDVARSARGIQTGAIEDQIQGAIGILVVITEATPFTWDDWIADTLKKIAETDAFPVLVQLVIGYLRDEEDVEGLMGTPAEYVAKQETVAKAGISWVAFVQLIPQIAKLIRAFR